MRKIGLIGGLSYLSSIEYYRIIQEEVNSMLGGHYSAEIVLLSLDFGPFVEAMFNGDWSLVRNRLIKAANELQSLGCSVIAICCNSVHKVFCEVEMSCKVKLLHVIEPTIKAILEKGIMNIGLLGTKFTMENDFHIKYMNQSNINIILPEKTVHKEINRIIFSEICHENISLASRCFLLEITKSLVRRGAQGIILACTELPKIISPKDVNTILFPTTDLHAKATSWLIVELLTICVAVCKDKFKYKYIVLNARMFHKQLFTQFVFLVIFAINE